MHSQCNSASQAIQVMVPSSSGSAGRRSRRSQQIQTSFTCHNDLLYSYTSQLHLLECRLSSSPVLLKVFHIMCMPDYHRDLNPSLPSTFVYVSRIRIRINSRWKRFVFWCCQRDIDPSTASIHRLADFLLFLFFKERLSYFVYYRL